MTGHIKWITVVVVFCLAIAPSLSQMVLGAETQRHVVVLPIGGEMSDEELLEVEGEWLWFLLGCFILGFTAGYFTYADTGSVWLAVRNGVIAVVGGVAGATLLAIPR